MSESTRDQGLVDEPTRDPQTQEVSLKSEDLLSGKGETAIVLRDHAPRRVYVIWGKNQLAVAQAVLKVRLIIGDEASLVNTTDLPWLCLGREYVSFFSRLCAFVDQQGGVGRMPVPMPGLCAHVAPAPPLEKGAGAFGMLGLQTAMKEQVFFYPDKLHGEQLLAGALEEQQGRGAELIRQERGRLAASVVPQFYCDPTVDAWPVIRLGSRVSRWIVRASAYYREVFGYDP